MATPNGKVLCFCALCKGKSVSKYIRKRHSMLASNVTAKRVCIVPSNLSTTEATNTYQPPSPSLETPAPDLDSEDEVVPEETSSTGQLSPNDGETSAQDMQIYSEILDDSGPASTPLYNGSPHTVLNTLIEHFRWFCEHPGISKEALSSMLSTQKHLLPQPNQLPESYDAALREIQPYIVSTQHYDICSNECILFRGEFEGLPVCPICGADRKESTRTFIYLPLIPRLKRLFGDSCMAAILQRHICIENDDNIIDDIHGSESWRKAYGDGGIFGGDACGISLSLCTDGVNPFAHNRVVYSMWPIMLSILNLPRHLRHIFGAIQLVGIIPSNHGREAKSIDPFLEVLVDELLEVSHSVFFDAYRNAPFRAKASVLLHVLDYPGICKVMGVVGSGGIQGCAFCKVSGQYDKHLHKTIYLENRRYLPEGSALRDDKNSFPDKSEEKRSKPDMKLYAEMRDNHIAFDNAPNRAQANMIAKATGCRGSYALMKFPEHDRSMQMVPDSMHTIKDVVEKIVCLILSKVNVEKVDMAEEGRVCSSEWALSESQISEAEKRLTQLDIPSHIDLDYTYVFRHPSRLKSHDWKQIACQGILKFCFRDMLGEKQRETLFFFLDVVTAVLAESHQKDSTIELGKKLDHALALLERDFPKSIQDITTHLMHHIVGGIQRFGPVYSTWMYCYERFNSWLCKRALNRHRPEATIMETYRIFEWVEFKKLAENERNQNQPSKQTHGNERILSDEDAKLLLLCLDQPHPQLDSLAVNELKKASRTEKTGRVVFFTRNQYVETHDGRIGKVLNTFVYSSVSYATLSLLSSPPDIVYGLLHFKNIKQGQTRRAIQPLHKLSKPLPVANTLSDMWVLNTVF